MEKKKDDNIVRLTESQSMALANFLIGSHKVYSRYLRSGKKLSGPIAKKVTSGDKKGEWELFFE